MFVHVWSEVVSKLFSQELAAALTKNAALSVTIVNKIERKIPEKT